MKHKGKQDTHEWYYKLSGEDLNRASENLRLLVGMERPIKEFMLGGYQKDDGPDDRT